MLFFLLVFFFFVIPIVIVGAIVYGIYKIITGTTKIITGTTERRKFANRFEDPNSEYYQQRENSRSELLQELGLSTTATIEQAHQKYREFAKELHPDVNPDPQATQKFMKIKQAYETILELNQQMA